MKKRDLRNDWALFFYITAYIKPYLGILFLATVALAGNLVLLLLRPYLTKQVIDLGFATNDIAVIEYYALMYGFTIIGSVLFIFVENYFLKSFGQKIIYNIRSIIFQKILNKPHDEFYKLPIGNWVTRITNDVESLRTLYTDVILNLASSGLMIIGILGFMYAINVPLAIIMTILLPIMGGIIWVFQKFSRKAFRQVRRSVAASNASIKELLNYIVIVKSYGGERAIEERYNTVNKGFLEAGLFEVTTFSIFRPLVDGLFFVALIVIFTTTNLIDSVADAGTVFAFIQYMDRFFQPLKEIADKYNSLQSALAGAERLVPLLEEEERQMANERLGTHATLTRGLVRGGGKKPWRQKGTGRARQGSIRAPQWRGGGIVFGPTPRSYDFKINKKVKNLALRSVLSQKVIDQELVALDNLAFDTIKTKNVVNFLGNFENPRKTLIVVDTLEENLVLSARNVPGVKVIEARNVNVYDVMDCTKLMMTEKAIKAVEEVLK